MSAVEGRPGKVLSCTACRERKTKCDKGQPVCTQCSRASLNCVYPSRKPTRRAPRPRQRELLDRISRLESIVGQVDPDRIRQLDAGQAETTLPDDGSARPVSERAPAAPPSEGSSDTANRYLSGEFWSNLCEEVDGIKQALDQPSEEEDEEEYRDSPESDAASRALLEGGGPGPAGCFILDSLDFQEQHPLVHPSKELRDSLWMLYIRNVDPLMKFLHRPTVTKKLEAIFERGQIPSPSANALVFCIYLASVTSLSPETCLEQFGEKQSALISRYRSSAERALAAADYLNTTDLVTLQAFTIYVSMLRCYSHGRASWALTSLLIRLAQAMNLHRDGDGRRFSAFEAEMRRRLWHFILVLDIRGSEDRGTDAIISRASWNTAPPTPIDDDDFGPNTSGPLTPKNGPADNIILVCTATCSAIFGYLQHPVTNAAGETEHVIFSEDELIEHVRRLEHTFIHTAVPEHLPSRYASEIARLVILKLWLAIQYPFSALPASARPRLARETMLRTAVSVMELSERMIEPPWNDRFAWWTATYVQWHPLAVALAELCVQTRGDLVDRSWEVVDYVYPLWRHKIADSMKGSLWRPIRKLYKRAKAAKDESVLHTLSLEESNAPASQPVAQSFGHPEPQGVSGPSTIQEAPSDALIDLALTAQPYDSARMDPSYLFEYPPELSYVDYSQFGLDCSIGWSPWNDFLNDTQMDVSPDASGSGGDSL